MNNWKNIHSDFTSKLQKEWENNNFTYNQAQDWISIGLTPQDCSFVVYLRDVLSCEPEEALNFVSDIEELRSQYREYLQSQNEESEESQLARAMALSFGIFDFRDNPLKGLTDQEAEQYLSTKRLNLEKYFVFNLGQEVKIKPRITVSDDSGKIVSEPIPNIRQVKPLFTEHLTQLFNDGHEKSAISFTGKNTNQPSAGWTGDKLDQKIKNGEEIYIVFDKSRIKANSSYVRSKASSVTQLGSMDWPEIIVLAMEAKPQVQVFQSKKNALRFLQEKEFEQNDLKTLVGSRTDVPSKIEEVVRFEAWWNNNLATVINKCGCYQVYLIVYEPERKKGNIKERILTFPLDHSENRWGLEGQNSRGRHRYLSGSQKEAEWLREKLNSGLIKVPNMLKLGNSQVPVNSFRSNEYYDHPILLVHPDCNSYCRFEEFVGSPYVEKLPTIGNSGFVPDNFDNYIEPFDIIKVKKRHKFFKVPFYHVGIYLGKNQVCHVYDYDEEKWMEARITNISIFLGNTKTTERVGGVEAYHPFIPFKHHEKTAKNLAWAKETKYGKGKYDLFNFNCEHFANMCVYGINYSEQIGKLEKQGFKHFLAKYGNDNNILIQVIVKPWWWSLIVDSARAGQKVSNNDKGQTIRLTSEIVEVNKKLGESGSKLAKQLEARVVIPQRIPTDKCRMM